MKYTIDEEDIRECFLNLLSSSMDKRTAMRFHTSYPEIIKQLEPDEARILDYLNIIRREIPVIDIKSQEGQGYHTVIKNYSKINWLESVINKENLNSYFDNLIRLNLIEISDGKWLSDDKLYTELENKSKKIQEEKLKIENGRVPKIKKKYITLTQFGKNFCECIIEKKGKNYNFVDEYGNQVENFDYRIFGWNG